jgi:hypothetical protein
VFSFWGRKKQTEVTTVYDNGSETDDWNNKKKKTAMKRMSKALKRRKKLLVELIK